MALTPLPSSTRFIQPGVTKCYWVPTIAAYPAAVTRTEIGTGTDLTGEIADVQGFSSKADFVETPDLSAQFVPKVPGRIKADDSMLSFYASRNGTDVRATLTQGTSGFVVWMDGGDVVGQKMDEFAVTIAAVSVMRNVAGTEVLRINMDFALTKVPGYNLTIA